MSVAIDAHHGHDIRGGRAPGLPPRRSDAPRSRAQPRTCAQTHRTWLRGPWSRQVAIVSTLGWMLIACRGGATGSAPARGADALEGSTTPDATIEACTPSPRPRHEPPHGTSALHRALSAWIGPAAVDMHVATIASPLWSIDVARAAIEAHAATDGAWHDPLDERWSDVSVLRTTLDERARWLAAQVEAGRWVEGETGAIAEIDRVTKAATPLAEAAAGEPAPLGVVHVLVAETTLWCGPSTLGLLSPARDLAFDRNRCSEIHGGELVLALAKSGGGWWFVDTGYATGWVHQPRWTPPVDRIAARAYAQPDRTLVILDDGVESSLGHRLRMGVRLPLIAAAGAPPEAVDVADGAPLAVLLPTESGFVEGTVPSSQRVRIGSLPPSRAHLLALAFAQLDAPYGWGGYASGRDCSRLVFDLLATTGYYVGRNSEAQSRAGLQTIEVADLPEAEKVAVIRQAATRGLVLLWMPGHIMLYLGTARDAQGIERDYALSSISEYVVPCRDEDGAGDRVDNSTEAALAQEAVLRLDRTEVTTLELGRGTSRTAFIERIGRIAIFGD